MKFEKADAKHFEPITMTLETELEYDVMKVILSTYSGKLSDATSIHENDIRTAFSKNTGHTAYDQLCAIQRRT